MNAVRVRRYSFVRESARLAALACLVVPVAGCQSGSWMSKPSWMTFGQKAEEAGRLSSAPAFAGDVAKPSATAKPYPTTSTPESYSLPAATAQAATAPGAAPAAVTYGSSPPPAATAPATSPATTASAAPVAAQVGPYATTSGPVPTEATAPGAAAVPPPASGWSSPALAAVPPQAAPASDPTATPSTAAPPWSTAPASPPAAAPPQRFADARAASPAWTPSAIDPPPVPDGRYAASGTSRFSTGAVPAAAAMMQPAPPAELRPAAIDPVTPAASEPAASATPAMPSRRPDPGYRPGGTSSYRSVRSSLAGEPASGVQPASFEAGAPGSN